MRWQLRILRYGLPAAIVVAAGLSFALAGGGDNARDGAAMLVGAGLSVYLLNALYRIGVSGERDRDREDAARRYFDEHGHWPDDVPSRPTDGA